MIISETSLKNIKKLRQGKVRDVYDLGDNLLIVATDRISAFDYVLPTPISDKGKFLTQLSVFWFDILKDVCPNHFITADIDKYPKELQQYKDILEGRSMFVKKAERIDIECIVRGYITGSGWKEYQKTGSICGIELPKGLLESAQLPEPIFTPSTKADSGHDENISLEEAKKIVGDKIAEEVKTKSIELYKKASEYARQKGIIIADTKFEFGIIGGEISLIDEVLTPDSSRFWDIEKYEPGRSQDSFDKQYVRDYLESIKWDKQPPVPKLPQNIVDGTSKKYSEICDRLEK